MRWLAILATIAMLLAACNGGNGGNGGTTPVGGSVEATPTGGEVSSEPTRVVVSIYPLAYFTERVGGDRVEVTTLIGPGVEAHDFEPTTSDLQTLQDADLVITNGLGLEPWLHNALEALGTQRPEHVLEISPSEGEGAHGEEDDHGHEDEDDHGHEDEDDHGHEDEDDHGHEDEDDHGHEDEDDHGHEDEDDHGHEDEDDHGHEDEDDHGHEDEDDHGHEDEDDHGHEDEDDHGHEDEEDEHGHDHGDADPHVWLDPLQAIEQVERIRDELIEIDSAHADNYRSAADTLISELRTLHDDFGSGLASCRHESFVTSHAAYGHLAERYGLSQLPIAGLTPDAEPSPQRLAEIIDEVTDLGLGFILVEPVLSDRLAQTIARETGVELLPIHAIESVTQKEFDEVGDYMALMRDNLANLRRSLECS